MLQKSARFHFLIWYLFILAVILSLFSLLIYGNFRQSIYDDLDDLLAARAQDITDSVLTYVKLKEDPVIRDNGTSVQLLESLNFFNTARDWFQIKGAEHEAVNVSLMMLDSHGKKIIASERSPKITPFTDEDMADILAGNESFDITKGETTDGKKGKFRVYSKPVMYKNKVLCVVQAVNHVDLLELALHNLSFVLCIFLPLTVLLAGIPGIFLIRVTLRPVDEMTQTMKKITAGNLKLRIHMPDTHDEIKRLADTFNTMLDRLERSLVCQDNFVEEITRGLREPLDLLRKDITALMSCYALNDQNRVVLANGLKRVDDIAQSLEALVVLTNIEEGKIPLEIRKADISRIVTGVVNDITPNAVIKAITIVTYIDPVIMIDCDQLQIKELIHVILDNAVKYTNRDGRIVVTVKQFHSNVKITVTDTGLGILEDEIPYIFDRFYQSGGNKRNKSGFGIGLSVARVILEEHHGKIDVSSQWGRGSTFLITLPITCPA